MGEEENVYKKESRNKALHKHYPIKKHLAVVKTEQTKLVCTLDKTAKNELL
jgi:hypothetical protein